jgi:hypothetical protein
LDTIFVLAGRTYILRRTISGRRVSMKSPIRISRCISDFLSPYLQVLHRESDLPVGKLDQRGDLGNDHTRDEQGRRRKRERIAQIRALSWLKKSKARMN